MSLYEYKAFSIEFRHSPQSVTWHHSSSPQLRMLGGNSRHFNSEMTILIWFGNYGRILKKEVELLYDIVHTVIF